MRAENFLANHMPHRAACTGLVRQWVNALSSSLVVEIARDKKLYSQSFARGLPLGPLAKIGTAPTGAVPA